MELRIKSMLGQLDVLADIVEHMHAAGIVQLPYFHEHANRLGDFPKLVRRNPFDQMLLVRAARIGLTPSPAASCYSHPPRR